MNVIIANKNKALLDTLDVDVIKTLEGEYTVEEIVQTFSNFFFNKMFLDITAISNYQDLSNIQKISMSLDAEKIILLLDGTPLTTNQAYISKLISIGFYNFTTNKEGLIYLYNNTNSYKDVAHLHQVRDSVPIASVTEERQESKQNNVQESLNVDIDNSSKNCKVIGFKNVTLHAGATTLIYMMKKILSNYFTVIGLEINKKDFSFFHDKEMISIDDNQLQMYINQFKDSSIILLDINDGMESYCDEIIYLMEPSTIKLNRMIMIDRGIFNRLKGKKIVLNQSMLDEKDIKDFESESNSKIFYNLSPLDDKKDVSNELIPFLVKLDLIKTSSSNNIH